MKQSGLSIVSLSQLVFVIRNDSCRTFCLCSFQDEVVSIKDKHPAFFSVQNKSVSHKNSLLQYIAVLHSFRDQSSDADYIKS